MGILRVGDHICYIYIFPRLQGAYTSSYHEVWEAGMEIFNKCMRNGFQGQAIRVGMLHADHYTLLKF